MTNSVAVTECCSAVIIFPQQIQGLKAQKNLKGYGMFKASYLTGCSVLSSGVLMQIKHSQWDNKICAYMHCDHNLAYGISDADRPVILWWSLRSRKENKSRLGRLDTGFVCSHRRTDMNMVIGTNKQSNPWGNNS
jgi:hypothetical protein